MAGRVAGKVALISGGAGGIGAASARALVAEGARIVVGDLAEDAGRELVDDLGDAARFVRLDVTRADDWAAAVALTVDEFGKLDVLFNNAGIVGSIAELKNYERQGWDQSLAVNLTGAFLGMQAAADAMIEAGGGSIINTSSIEGLRGTGFVHGYVASKWGLRGLTKSVAMELAPHGIRVNSLHPGLIRTPLTDGIPDDLLDIPLGRAGQPEDVAGFVVFLASDESSYATGTEFTMDGGVVNQVPHKS